MFTQNQVDKAIAFRIEPPYEDIVDGTNDVSNKTTVVAGTEYRLEINSIARQKQNGFTVESEITKMWDIADNTVKFSEFPDSPVFVSKPNCVFQPSSSAEGQCIIRAYVNETSPILFDQQGVVFKGSTPETISSLFSYYIGSELGFDIKNKGLYFTFEFNKAGLLWDMACINYLT